MPRARCPLCQSPVQIDERKPDSRLSCGNCHADLHMSKEGRLLLGDPPDIEAPIRELQREFRRLSKGFPVRMVITGLALFLVAVVGLYQLFGPAERLDLVAERAAHALAEGNQDTLKSLAAPDTADEVRRWYEAVHPRLDRLRKEWGGRTEVVAIRVDGVESDPQKGSVIIAIEPATSGARDVSLADPSNATASASMPFEELTDWTLTRWGRWKLDGRASLAKLPKAQAAR